MTLYFRFLARKKVSQIRATLLSERRSKAAVIIQTAWKGFSARQHFEEMMSWRNVAATLIQKTWKAYKSRTTYMATLRNIVRIQTAWRGFAARHRLAIILSERNVAATFIQKTWKAYKARQNYMVTLRSIIRIQCLFRRRLAVKKVANRRRILMDRRKREERNAVKLQVTNQSNFCDAWNFGFLIGRPLMAHMIIFYDNSLILVILSCSKAFFTVNWKFLTPPLRAWHCLRTTPSVNDTTVTMTTASVATFVSWRRLCKKRGRGSRKVA